LFARLLGLLEHLDHEDAQQGVAAERSIDRLAHLAGGLWLPVCASIGCA
jgi:hypothetical protein